MDGTSFPLQSDSITKQSRCIHGYKNVYTGGSPMNLSLTYIDYFIYSKYYCGCPVASAAGSNDEDKSYAISDGTTFGSVEGRATFTSNPGYTPSTGWATSSWRVPSAMLAR